MQKKLKHFKQTFGVYTSINVSMVSFDEYDITADLQTWVKINMELHQSSKGYKIVKGVWLF